MNSRSSILTNATSLLILQIANYIIPLIIFPYLVRTLGTEKFGLLAFSQAFTQYFIIFTDYGFDLTATRDIALNQNDPQRISKIFWNIMTIKFSLAIFCLLLLSFILLILKIPDSEKFVYYATFLTVFGTVLFPTWFFQGIEKMNFIPILVLTSKTISLLLILAFVRGTGDYLLAAFFQSLGWFLAGVLGFATSIFFFPKIFIPPKWQEIKKFLIDGWYVFVSQLSTTILGNTQTFILGLFSGFQNVGYFSIADKITRAFVGISAPISKAIYPRVSAQFKESKKEPMVFLKKVLIFGGLIFLFLSLVLIFGATAIVKLITGKTNGTIETLIKIMGIIPFTIFINNIFGTQVMLNVGMQKHFMYSLIFSGILTIVLSLILVPVYGPFGSALVVLFTEIFLMGLMYVFIHQRGYKFFHFLFPKPSEV